MKYISGLSVVFLILVLLIGCGGGGGGGGGGTGTGTYSYQQVTGYLSTGAMLDTRNLLVGDSVQLYITGFDKNLNLKSFTASGWKTDAPATVATLTSAGALTAVGVSNQTYKIQVVYQGLTYSANLLVSPTQAIVTGIVRNVSNPIGDVGVDFYDKTGAQVGVSYTARDGTFRASVPVTAVSFTIDMSLADPKNYYYYTQYGYGTADYLEAATCLTALPTLSLASPTALPNPIVPDERAGQAPPPPPTGCVG